MGRVFVGHLEFAERIRGGSKISLVEKGIREGSEANLFQAIRKGHVDIFGCVPRREVHWSRQCSAV